MVQRTIIAAMLAALVAGPAAAQEVSTTCSVEWSRRMAIVSSDYAQKQPPWRYWVAHNGATLGPWPILDIKRRMLKGELPTQVHVYNADGGEWQLSTAMNDFAPLPGSAAVGGAEVARNLAGLVAGCWVSDPVSEAPGEETTWLLFLMPNGVLMHSRGTIQTATAQEGFWFSRSSNESWGVAGQVGTTFTLRLPDINYFDPVDQHPASLVDRNTLSVRFPDGRQWTFRRM